MNTLFKESCCGEPRENPIFEVPFVFFGSEGTAKEALFFHTPKAQFTRVP